MERIRNWRWYPFLKVNFIIIAYLLQILFVLIYSEPEVEPFVYVRF